VILSPLKKGVLPPISLLSNPPKLDLLFLVLGVMNVTTATFAVFAVCGLGGARGLVARLGLRRRDVGAVCRGTGLLCGFRLLARCCGWSVAVSSEVDVFICILLGGDYRGQDMVHSGARKMQVDSEEDQKRRWKGDGVAGQCSPARSLIRYMLRF
jgi:hypothetical protein